MTEPTNNVNPFNGKSDPHEDAETAQKLWDAGAFNPDGKPDPEQGQKGAEAPEGRQERASTEERPAWHDSYEAMERAEKFAEESRAQNARQVHQALAAGQQAQQQLAASYHAVPWDRLRAENPQAADALLGEYQAREQQINQHLAGAHSQAHGLANDHLAAEGEKTLRHMPEWRDKQKFESAKADMLEYASKHGISRAEVEAITDHRHFLALYHASQAGKSPPPKGPGVRLNKVSKNQATPPELKPVIAARDRFMNDPRDQDAQSAYAQRLLDAGA